MVWVVELEHVIAGKMVSRKKVMAIERPEQLQRLEDLGLKLEEGKTLLAALQQLLVAQQCERDQDTRTPCPACGQRRRIKDYRRRCFDTVFGRVAVRRARFACGHHACKAGTERALPGLRGRSTPEFDALRAKFSALLSYRVARRQLCELLPVSTGYGRDMCTCLMRHVHVLRLYPNIAPVALRRLKRNACVQQVLLQARAVCPATRARKPCTGLY